MVLGLLQVADGLANLASDQPGCAATALGFVEIGWGPVSGLVAALLLLSGPRSILWWPISFVAYASFGIVQGLAVAIGQGSDAAAVDIPRWVWVAQILFGTYFALASAVSLKVLRGRNHLRSSQSTA